MKIFPALLTAALLLTGCGAQKPAISPTSTATHADAKTDGFVTGDSATDKSPADDSVTENFPADSSVTDDFLAAADAVTVTETSVTFTDATGSTITLDKCPTSTVILYPSFTTLWYEAGGTVSGCIGGDSASELYLEYIGRDITTDENVSVVSRSPAASKWDIEAILRDAPDLIICSTAMSGYTTIESPAKSAEIPLVAVDYDDFSDYLKWFKVFCHLNDRADLWDSVAMHALNSVAEVLESCPTNENPRVLCLFSGEDSLHANTSATTIGAMLDALHAENIVSAWQNPTNAERLELNLETIYTANPDIILVQCHTGMDTAQQLVAAQLGDNPVWNSLTAVQEGRVFYLDKTLFHNKPNARFAEAYEILADHLYP